ncbi:MAG: ATP-binding protein [Acidobacteriota bacterium]
MSSETENELVQLLDTMLLPAALIDADLNCLYANSALQVFLGCQVADLTANKITKFIRAKEPRPSANLTERLADGQVNCGDWEFFLAGGTTAWAEILSNKLSDGLFLIFINDATGRKRAELALLESERHHLQAQKIEALGRLAGGVAHDFNNFLAVILLHIDILNMQLPPDSPVAKRVSEIKEVSNNAARIIRQLLAFGRKQPMTPAPVTLNKTIEELSIQLPTVLGTEIQLTTKLDQDLGVCFVDRAQVVQILSSLALNAKDAMPEGGRLRIETANLIFAKGDSNKPQAGGSYVEIAVSDNGVGMDAKTVEHIFEPFFSTKGSDKGAGLGLAMVYGIIKQMGGFIWVESVIDAGTTFRIQFPRIDQEVERSEPETIAEKEASVRNETILLVDDEDAVRRLTAEILRMAGYEVFEASSGMMALEIARSYDKPIDLLLTDFSMPQLNGREVAERLSDLHPEISVLVISGNIVDSMPVVAGAKKKFYFLGKPYSPTELEVKVREIFDAR